jgi:YmgG-like glycine-zipper protein
MYLSEPLIYDMRLSEEV